jgi:hypothetical protein
MHVGMMIKDPHTVDTGQIVCTHYRNEITGANQRALHDYWNGARTLF